MSVGAKTADADIPTLIRNPTNCSIWQFGFRLSANTNTFENILKKSVILIDLGGR